MRTILLAGVALVVAVATVTAGPTDATVVDAVRAGDTAAVHALLKARADVNARQPDGASALHWAAHRDDRDAARLLLEFRADANAVDDYGMTPLMLAAGNGSASMILMLIGGGADVNQSQPSGETPLMAAARTGSAPAVDALLRAGANANAREAWRGQTALMWAASQRHGPVVRQLIAHGAKVDARSNTGFTPLLFAARSGALDVAQVLMAAGAGVDGAADDGMTPLLVATVRGHTGFARALLDAGANPNASQVGYTALHWAAGQWHSSLNGEYPDAVLARSEWARLAGVTDGKIELIKSLLAHGADPNARVTRTPPRFGFHLFKMPLVGATPFLLAAMVGDTSVMKLLAASGADPQAVTNDGTTPLIAASGLARIDGETPVPEASHLAAATLALQLGGDVNVANAAGDTPLHAAAFAGFDTLVRMLVERGARVNARNAGDETPLKIAEGYELNATLFVRTSTAALLRELGGTR